MVLLSEKGWPSLFPTSPNSPSKALGPRNQESIKNSLVLSSAMGQTSCHPTTSLTDSVDSSVYPSHLTAEKGRRGGNVRNNNYTETGSLQSALHVISFLKLGGPPSHSFHAIQHCKWHAAHGRYLERWGKTITIWDHQPGARAEFRILSQPQSL